MQSTGSRQIKKPEFKLLAGQMLVENGKVKPSPNKGELRFTYNPDNLLIFEWKDLNTNITSEPLVIFDSEWEWKKIGTQKGRVFCLQSTTFGDKFYYWMQYPNAEEDHVNENIISNILKTGRLEINEEKGSSDNGASSVENIIKNEEQKPVTNTTNVQPSNQNKSSTNADFIKNFANSLKGTKKRKLSY
jgi:hypothetical protein